MKGRKHIAIYIDYAIRIPNFKKTYELFKASLFKDNNDIEFNDKIEDSDVRFFWNIELKNKEVEKFYMSKDVNKIIDEELLNSFEHYFYNKQHLQKFLEEYSYNLYCDCDVASYKDIELINICQSQLFDVTLIDTFSTVRKISNTFFFLSKSRIYPRNVIFLGPNQQINKDNFVAIWNPMENKGQMNSNQSEVFLNWLMDLEKTEKNDKEEKI